MYATFCIRCKEKGVDTRGDYVTRKSILTYEPTKVCSVEGCKLRARAELKDPPHVLFCGKHSRPYPSEDINRISYFKYNSERDQEIYCKDHKTWDMVNRTAKLCPVCKFHTVQFGVVGSLPTRCKKCAPAGYISHPTTVCKTQGCKDIATHGPCKWANVHCETHKDDLDFSQALRECEGCKRIRVLPKPPLCDECSGHRCVRKKEKRVLEYLRDTLSDVEFLVENKKATLGDKAYRPDLILRHTVTKKIIHVEVDERQHRSYKNEPERLLDIYDYCLETYGDLPVVTLRYNPDTLRHYDLVCVDVPFEERAQTLREIIERAFQFESQKDRHRVPAYKLFYDGPVDARPVQCKGLDDREIKHLYETLIPEKNRERRPRPPEPETPIITPITLHVYNPDRPREPVFKPYIPPKIEP